MGALGFHPAVGWCLPVVALGHPGLRAVLEDTRVTKAVHNQSVDDHSLANHGVTLRGAVNTLGLVRWKMPGLINQPGRFALKPLMQTLLHREPVTSFKELVSWEGTEPYSTWRKVERSICECGVDGCRRRVQGHEKRKETHSIETVRERKTAGTYALDTILPQSPTTEEHPRWGLLVRYAIEDAVAALEVLELCQGTKDPAPFFYGDTRPGFSQQAENDIIAMERVGIPVDVGYCAEKLTVAEADERRELDWLQRWYTLNAGYGPHRPEDVDSIWSSGVKKLALFDELEFPRSPIWAKGRVKPGEAKLDHAAMDWIATAHPPAAKLCEHLLRLQRVRSGMKYLVKLRDSGGMVYPVCGSAGDDDERSGAVTGRLGVKGELEAQQLPQAGKKDLYEIRRAIIPGPGETLIVADYTSLEIAIQGDFLLRLFDDDQIAKLYADPDADIHSINAREVFGRWLKWDGVLDIPLAEFPEHKLGKVCRNLIKAVWFGLAYGKFDFSTLVGADGKMIGRDLSNKMREALLDAVPGMRRWFRWVEQQVRKHHGIYSLGGRWCDLSLEMESLDEWLHKRAFRRGYNFPMQATGAEIIADALRRVNADPEFRALGFRVCLQVHDELVARGPLENAPRAMEILIHHMESVTANGTPLLFKPRVKAEAGFNYFAAK